MSDLNVIMLAAGVMINTAHIVWVGQRVLRLECARRFNETVNRVDNSLTEMRKWNESRRREIDHKLRGV